MRVRAADDLLELVSLQERGAAREWIDRAQGTDIPLVATAMVAGTTVRLRWRLAAVARPRIGVAFFHFRNASPRLELTSEWTAAVGPGPVEHTISIRNLSGSAVELPLQPSLRFACRTPSGDAPHCWWVEKGAGAPTSAGTHVETVTRGWHRDLDSSSYAEDGPDREPIPWAAVQDTTARCGWYAGVESSARVRIGFSARTSDVEGAPRLAAQMGFAPERPGSPPYRTRLAPSETLVAPTVFVGCYAGDVDDGCNVVRRWVERSVRPPVADARYPLLVLNSWGSGMTVDEALLRRMADDAASLGIEMLHQDAGWFRGVGDWRANPAKFPHGLRAIADYAHARGLKFGLWVGWTQGGIDPDAEDRARILNVFAPDRRDWFARELSPGWKPADFTGADLCLAAPAADTWCLNLLDEIVRDYRLDMLEHDQRMIVDACVRADHPHTASRTDISYRAAQGYYRVYDALRTRHPSLLFEDCVNGGRTVDYGSLRRVHYVSITDTYSPLANRRAFYDASYALPPAMCECYVENVPVTTAAQFRTMLRSGMMGWCTIMCDTTRWTPEQHNIARRQFHLYKRRIRPLIRSGNLYHVAPRPDGVHWDGIQYAAASRGSAVLFAFRGSAGSSAHTFRLRGLDPAAIYAVHVEDTGTVSRATGSALMAAGLAVRVPEPGASDLAFVDRVHATPVRSPVGRGPAPRLIPVADAPDSKLPLVLTVERRPFGRVLEAWDRPTGRLLWQTPLDGSLSADRRLLVTTSERQLSHDSRRVELRVWDWRTSRVLRTISGVDLDALAISPHGEYVAASDESGRIHLWRTNTGAHLLLEGPVHFVDALSFSARGDDLIAEMEWQPYDRVHIARWAMPSGRQLSRLSVSMPNHGRPVISPDGRTVAVLQRQFCVALIDARTGRIRCRITARARVSGEITFSPDGRLVYTPVVDELHGPGWVDAWRTDSGEHVGTFAGGEAVQESRVIACPDARLVAVVGTRDDSLAVSLWPARGGAELGSYQAPGLAACNLTVGADRRLLATAHGNAVALWRLSAASLIDAALSPSECVVLSADGRSLATASAVLDVPTLRELWRAPFPESSWRARIEPSPTSDRAVLTYATTEGAPLPRELSTAELRDGRTGAKIATLVRAAPPGGCEATWTPDGRYVATWGTYQDVRLWDGHTGAQVVAMPPNAAKVWRLATTDTRVAAEIYDDGRTVACWNIPSGRPAWRVKLPYIGQWELATSGGMLIAWDRGNVVSIDWATGAIRRMPRHESDRLRDANGQPLIQPWNIYEQDIAVSQAKLYGADQRRPLASFLLLTAPQGSQPAEWLIYTPDGYYTGSSGVEAHLRWVVGNRLLPGDALAARYRRPDLVVRALRRLPK